MGADVGRRGFLMLGAGALLAGCSARRAAPRPTRTTAPASPGHPSAASARRALPAVTPWRPNRGDIEPAAKVAAVRVVEARGNGRERALEVIEAQYGGLLGESACVLVVCRSWARDVAGAVHAGGSTYDVRLSRRASGWRVTAVHPSHPGPATPRLSLAARNVLTNPRIDLPPAAHADIASGQVHDSVLDAMLTLAKDFRIGVSVVRSGHPTYVFGTHRLSDHPRGRAFDTWRLDGQMVVDPGTPRRLVARYMEAAAAAGSYNVGGPYAPGPAPQFFTDATHHDHVHAGFAA